VVAGPGRSPAGSGHQRTECRRAARLDVLWPV